MQSGLRYIGIGTSAYATSNPGIQGRLSRIQVMLQINVQVQVETSSKKSKKSGQGDYSNFEFVECGLKLQIIPQRGLLRDACILSQTIHSKFK